MRYLSPVLLPTLSWLLVSPARADIVSILPCESNGITLHTDDRDGLYDGVSQGGMSLVLYNAGKGPACCRRYRRWNSAMRNTYR